jgi:hypothetical protein
MAQHHDLDYMRPRIQIQLVFLELTYHKFLVYQSALNFTLYSILTIKFLWSTKAGSAAAS